MTMISVSCSNCGEWVDVSARLLVLPFVCDECKDAQEFQQKIAPTVNSAINSVMNRTASGVRASNPEPVVKALQDVRDWALSPERLLQVGQMKQAATESVENATEIIADLERQAETSNALIADLKAANDKLTEERSTLMSAVTVLTERVEVWRTRAFDMRRKRDLLSFLATSSRQDATFWRNQYGAPQLPYVGDPPGWMGGATITGPVLTCKAVNQTETTAVPDATGSSTVDDCPF